MVEGGEEGEGRVRVRTAVELSEVLVCDEHTNIFRNVRR